MKLNREQILAIPALIKQGKTVTQIAQMYGVHRKTLTRWVRIMRRQGFVVPVKRGRPALKIK